MTDERKTAPSSSLPRLADLRTIDDESKFDCMLVALDWAIFNYSGDSITRAIKYIDRVTDRARLATITSDEWENGWALIDIAKLKSLRQSLESALDNARELIKCKDVWGKLADAYKAFLGAADWSSRIESPGLYKKLSAGELE